MTDIATTDADEVSSSPTSAGAQTLFKGLEVLSRVAKGDTTLGKMAKSLDLNKTTVHRLASTLVEAGFLSFSPREGYALGTKLLELTVHDTVAFETDGWTGDEAWSVVVHGRARQLDHQAEIDEADALPLEPWIPTLKYRYIHIDIDRMTGRRFRREPEPERW